MYKLDIGRQPRPCCLLLQLFDGSDEQKEAFVVSGELVTSGGDPAEVFDPTEEALDGVALLVDGGIKRAAMGGACSAWHDGYGAGRGDGVHGALSVIGLVREHEAGTKAAE